MTQRAVSPPSSTFGFSLIELLVVAAVIGLFAALMVPAFNSNGHARGVTEAGYQVTGVVELARFSSTNSGPLALLPV